MAAFNCKLNARFATRFPFRSSGWPWICRFGQGLSKENNVAISRGWCGFNQAWEVVHLINLDLSRKPKVTKWGICERPSEANNAPVNQSRTFKNDLLDLWCSTECIQNHWLSWADTLQLKLSCSTSKAKKYHPAWSKSIAKVKTKVFTCHPNPKNAKTVMKRSPFLLHTKHVFHPKGQEEKNPSSR